jgi:RHS repeat-associated protein
MMKRIALSLLIAAAAFATAPLAAQTTPPDVSFADDFQSYGTQKNPPGWVDTSVGSSKPAAGGLYKTWPDPLEGNKGTNIVFGTKQSSGKPDGNNPRIGTFSTYTAKTFAGKGRFEYRGRFIRTNTDTRIGFTLFSSYPETDHYYLLGLWEQGSASTLTMQIFSFGAGALTGTVDSTFTPAVNKWYRFAIQADDVEGATFLRARFWLEGDPEPAKWSIDAKDSTATRLTSGRIGLWSAVKGDAYIDDITAKSPVDHGPPVITFTDLDTSKLLDPKVQALFKTPARIQVNITDDSSSIPTKDIKLDGNAYVSGTPIAGDGTHAITVHAVDGAGNAADATLNLLVDTHPPVITLLANNAPFTDGQIFPVDVTVSAQLDDISLKSTTSKVDDTTVTLPLPVVEEKAHSVFVTALDATGNTASVTRGFIVDKSKPVITVFANNAELTAGATFSTPVTLTWNVTDLTLDTVTARLDGNTIASGTVVSNAQLHTLVITATDKATHSETVTRTFPLDTTKPAVTIIANGEPFREGKAYNKPVKFTFDIHAATATTTAAKVDGTRTIVDGDTVSDEKPDHTIYVKVTNAAGLFTELGPFPFSIDLTPPVISLTENGSDFAGQTKFARDVQPKVTVTDNQTANPETHLFVDGLEYPLGAAITAERADHTISVTAVDLAGNSAKLGPFSFILDKSKPVVTLTDGAGKPFAADGSSLFKDPVRLRVTVADITDAPPALLLKGTALPLGTGVKQTDGSYVYTSAAIAADDIYTVSVTATDAVGLTSDPVTATFRIDSTPPVLTFTAPPASSTVSAPTALVRGTSDDAVTVVVNGRDANVDTTAKTFDITGVSLLEGRNEITAAGTDKAGNVGTAKLVLFLDTRPPDVVITAPLAGACVSGAALAVSGRATDPNLASITLEVTPGGGSVTITPAADGTFSGSLPLGAEGKAVLSVTAADGTGHTTVSTLPLMIDRTAPAIELTSGGNAFTGGIFNRTLAVTVRTGDADPAASLTVTLNGQPYVSGTSIANEGSYALRVTARDCAGNTRQASADFTIDKTAPKILTFAPAAGSTISSATAPTTGTLDADDTASVVVDGSGLAATLNGRNFSLATTLAEGTNSLVLVATDRAGNSSRTPYSVTVKTTTPVVKIMESGLPFPPNALYSRDVRPVITTNEPAAHITATLDNAPFTSGTLVTADGTHTVHATVHDDAGHAAEDSATFTIDRTAPGVTVTEPLDGATIAAASVPVKGTTTGNVIRVTVNGGEAALAGNAFSATLPLDLGANPILVTAYDRAGNSAAAHLTVTRADNQPGLVLTTPADGTITNRPTIPVGGQVLTPGTGAHVSINTNDVVPDAAGGFRLDALALHEGDNTITASVAGGARSVTVHVLADFTPPLLKVFANDVEMTAAMRFATSPAIRLEASDNNPAGLKTTLTIDGVVITGASPSLLDGGHALTAIATDAAGNQTRIDRTFSVGSTASNTGGCTLSNFDPPNNAAVFSDSLTFTGRSGGAAAVLINGVRAGLDSGSFAASLALPHDGANVVTVACADGNGVPTSDPQSTVTIYRYTNTPSITITYPTPEPALGTSVVSVTGTVGADVVSGDVNGKPFTPANGTYSVPGVSLAPGLNIITAHGRNAAGRAGVATVRVVVSTGAPALSITSPLPLTETGATTIDVSGTYLNVEPSSVKVGNVAAVTHPTSDTSGTFVANVALAPNATSTLTATAHNAAGVEATAGVDVQQVTGPSIQIGTPADNTIYPANAAAPDAVTGTFSAPAGSTVSVNGTVAVVTGNAFTAPAVFQPSSDGSTIVTARVTTTTGASATDSIRVVRLTKALTVLSSFPEADAVVDPGVLVVVFFSNPLERSTAAAALSLVDEGGTSITGRAFVDNDAISFAPDVPLAAGRRYTFTVSQALKDLGGQSLAAPFALPFRTAATAPAAAPVVNNADKTECLTTDTITGLASVAGARVRLTLDGSPTSTIAAADRSFSFVINFTGQAGYHIARIVELGADGTLSSERDVTYRINCSGPSVVAATLDRAVKKLTIQFSKPMTAATLTAAATGSIQLRAGSAAPLAGSVTLNTAGDVATVGYTGDLAASFTLTVTTAAHDAGGVPLAADYVQSFPLDASGPAGNGYITGAVYDATNGRPLQGATVVITPAANGTSTTDEHGRYTSSSLGEGAFGIEAGAAGFTKIWRQVVVPAGSGVVPIDIRLTRRGADANSGADVTLHDGGDTAVTKAAELFVPSAALPPGHTLTLTAVGGQSLGGLLPLGWSPLASVEVAVDHSAIPAALPAAKLTFLLAQADADALSAASRTLSVAQYDQTRDEWRTVVAAAPVGANNRITVDVQTSGNYALVYPDAAPLPYPPPARAGTTLQGVANPCGATPEVCRLRANDFKINPPSVAPSGRATASLVTWGDDKNYPSGTAVQAYIDEQLNLADGSVRIDPPFATDLLMYRTPAGNLATALFHIAPTPQAATVTLRDGVDHVRVVDYPGRIDRGTLIGGEGGRVPGDDSITIDIPTGATAEALHASATPMTAADLAALGAIPGFHLAGGFTLALTRANDGPPVDLDGDGKPDLLPVSLLKPANGTFTVDLSKFATANRQVIVGELLDKTGFGPVVRLAATTTATSAVATGVQVVTTDAVNPATLPLDGILRDGRYVILTADAPLAFAWGQVRLNAPTGPAVPNALVTASPLGVRDVSRTGGGFVLPVPAQPAAPFTLTPRSVPTGDGATATAAASPAVNAKVAFGPLVLAAQVPHLLGITPDGVEVSTSGFQAVATFDLDIATDSVAGAIVVTNVTTGSTVAGTVSASGKQVTFVPAGVLASGSRYTIIVNPTIRSTAGAPLGTGGGATFTTPAAPPANANINAAKIQITVPENGVAVIRGTAGALPVGDIALAIRRGNFFVEQYQQQVTATDGSFSFTIGKATGPDRVTTSDKIDLQIQDAVSHAIVAVIPLTPFVTADGLGFIAATDETSTFTTADGVTVTVPAGAFAVPTTVKVLPSTKSDFAAVPSLDAEQHFYAAVDVQFDGTASKPLELDIPAPAGLTADGKVLVLGRLGSSSRGQRMEVDDLVSIVNGRFTTRRQSGASSVVRVSKSLSVGSNETLIGGDVRDYLIKTIKMGKYAVTDIQIPLAEPVAWSVIDGLQSNLDIFWDLYHSLYCSEFYLTAGHGRVVVPVISKTPFTVQGVDAATGFTLFQHRYDGITPAAPGQVVGIPALEPNTGGPVPVFGDPFSIQTADVVAGVDSIKSVLGVTINTSWATSNDSGQVSVTLANPASTDPPRHLQVLNVRSGELTVDSSNSTSIAAKVGDRLIVFTQSERIDPRADLTVVFNEPIDVPASALASEEAFQTYMRGLFELQKNAAANPTDPANFQPMGAQTLFSLDSGNRRVLIHADLQSGADYRLRLKAGIADSYTGTGGPLKLAQIPGGSALTDGIDLYFAVRKPKGNLLTPFALKHGNVRDLALDGNLLFVSAQEGGLYAYDASDPANLDTTKLAWAAAIPTGTGESWAVTVDDHGRVWTTALTGEFGVIRTFRTEDFIDKLAAPSGTDPDPVKPYAGGSVSWRTGITVGINSGLDTVLLSDRPEATPRKLQIVSQDDKVEWTVDKDFDTKLGQPNALSVSGSFTGTLDEFRKYTLTIPTSSGSAGATPSGYPYVSQRITVRNVTAGLRWSKDGRSGAAGVLPITFDQVLVRAGDQIRVERNMMTYGVISLFGYGVGIYDLNAIESNSRVAQWDPAFGPAPSYKPLATMVDLTNGNSTLTFSPEAMVLAGSVPNGAAVKPLLTAVALVPATGVSIFTATPKEGLEANGPTAAYDPVGADTYTGQTISIANLGMMQTVKKLVSANGSRPFMGRFNSIARYDLNGSTYALVSGGQYGIIVLDVTNPSTPAIVDVIWVPKGAWAVRAVGNRYATSLDGDGRSLLIDLTRVDERASAKLAPCSGCTPVFPTLAGSLAAGYNGTNDSFGTDDPRIVWRGEKPYDPSNPGAGTFNTTLAPVADPDTGILYAGTLLQAYVRVQSGIDPRISLKVNLGTGGLTDVTSIVPLGIQPQKGVADNLAKLTPCATSGIDTQQPTPCRENASQGVFRIEMNLPGAVSNAVASGKIEVALESERVVDGLTEQTQDPLPRAHLRQRRAGDGSGLILNENRPATFTLQRVIKDSYVSTPAQKYLRLQKGFNKYISPWVIAIADPRASSQYQWDPAAVREDAGCFQCTPPPFLASPGSGKFLDTDYFEIYTLGRYLTLRPEVTTSGGTTSIFESAGNYKYLGDHRRVFARFGTIPADTVRPADVLVAGNAAPVATGTIGSTVYLHSGEMETSDIDFDAGGRAGWDVVIDRTYRSRTLGWTPFGWGWDSSIYQRLRQLPTGDVEYRNGAGEVWLFRTTGAGYTAPKGFPLHLVHTEQGWTLIDQKRRVTYFDELGRVSKRTDEFYTPDGKGNVVRYAYDEHGRLSSITDPVDRTTKLEYYDDAAHDGMIKQITDWHSSPARTLKYTFDDRMRLTKTELPDFNLVSGGSVSPKRKYDYDINQNGSYKDKVDLSTNLTKVIDPVEADGSNQERIKFTYNGSPRDYVTEERWGTGETAKYQYTPGAAPKADVTDVLGQIRHYTFKMPPKPADDKKLDWYSQERAHVDTLTEDSVEVSTAPFGALPAGIPTPLAVAPFTTTNREYKFEYNDGDDTLKSSTLKNGWQKGASYASAGPDLGNVMNGVSVTAPASSATAARRAPQDANAGALNFQMNLRSGGAFLDSITAGGKTIESHQPERNTLQPTNANSVSSTPQFDETTGLPTALDSSGGTGTCSGNCGVKSVIHYPPATASLLAYKRGLPDYVTEGTAALKTTFDYESENKTKITDPRGVSAETEYDSWGRPSRVTVTSSDSQVLKYETDYDATGRVHEIRRQQGGVMMATTYAYDVMGRVTSMTSDHVAAEGNLNNKVVEKDDYASFASGTITHTGSGGSVTTTTLDKLGRTKRRATTTGAFSSDIVQVTSYDIANNPVYTSDTIKFATTNAYDLGRRLTDSQHADGSKEHYDYDGFGRVKRLARRDKNDNEIFFRQTQYRDDGQILNITEGGNGGSRTVTRTWDAAGRTSGVSVSGADQPRAALREVDDAGRLQTRTIGSGSATAINSPFSQSTYSGYGDSATLPTSVSNQELQTGAAPSRVETSLSSFDTLGNPKSISVGGLTWTREHDEAGNVVKSSLPNRPEESFARDSRGAVTTHTLPDSKTQVFDYHLTGTEKSFKDPTDESTSIDHDLIGRPATIHYIDGSTTSIKYDGARLFAVKDRQNRWQSYVYENGHLTEIWATSNGKSGDLSLKLDQIDYDDAGRVIALTNPDARIDFQNLTFDGKPQLTIQTRYKNHKGLQNPTPVDRLDFFQQTHGYNALGERTSYTIPPAAAAGFPGSATLQYDAMGNVRSLQLDDGVTMNSQFRAPGRPNQRDLSLPATSGSPKILRRTYGYQSGTGQLNEMTASIVDPSTTASTIVAGSHVTFDGLQIGDAQLLGVSGGTRHTRYSYDARGRVAGFLTAASGDAAPPAAGGKVKAPGSGLEAPDEADFRAAQTRAPLFDAATIAELEKHGVKASSIDPPGMSVTAAAGHKIGSVTRDGKTRTFDYGGQSELIDDGQYLYHYDTKGRLIWVMDRPVAASTTIRRIRYDYDSRNRLVGRTAQAAAVAAVPVTDVDALQWDTETRADMLNADGLPAETTLIWDPVVDRLLTVVRTGASFIENDPNANIVKQFIHGESGYDDPIQITTLDPMAPQVPGQPTPVKKLYPVYDEAGAGSLQVLLNNKGEVVARSVTTDPYGGVRFDLSAAAVDHVAVTAKKNEQGNVESVTVTLRATEQLSASTVAAGSRLAAVDADGAVVRTTSVAATADPTDPFTMKWTLPASDWAALTDPSPATVGGVTRTPATLSIAVTSSLRASVWATDVPFLAAPAWAVASKAVFTSSALPVEVRESLSDLNTLVASTAAGAEKTSASYDVSNLSLVGTDGGSLDVASLFNSSFQAQPFSEPFSRKVYVRARWYDPLTGMWLTPDPAGYRDSSSLYAFAGGDPVNGRDPTGLLCETANASGVLDWLGRCAQDALSVGVEMAKGLADGHNLERASGGADATAELVGKTVAGVAVLAWDLSTASFNDDAADRLVQRGQAASDFASHPIESLKNMHTEAFDNILEAEQRGDYKASGNAAASIAQQDYLMLEGAAAAAKLGLAGARLAATGLRSLAEAAPEVLRSSGGLPSTGTAAFDELVVGTTKYERWAANVSGRGFSIVEDALPEGTAAEIEGRVMTVDPDQFRYIDLLHESRHVRQLELAGDMPLNTATRSWFERGAYEYEQRVGSANGFSQEYMDFVDTRINDYWTRSLQKKYFYGGQFKSLMDSLWK